PRGSAQRSRDHEREAAAAAPRVVEAVEAELAAAGVVPQTEHVTASEVADPRLVQEHDRRLALRVRMLDAEVERVLVRRRLQPSARGLGHDVRGGHLALEHQQRELAHPAAAGVTRGKVLREDRGMRVAVAARLHQRLGGAPVANGDGIEGRPGSAGVARRLGGLGGHIRGPHLTKCYAPRRRGSSLSRRASPKRLEPNTARLMARPGKSTRCGAFWAYSAAETESIRPHDGYGSGTPSPRNDRAASTRMAAPSCAVTSTMNGPTVFGSTWRNAIRRWVRPSARAASMYCISRIDSTLARITREARGTIGLEIAMMTFWIDGPSEADITRASTSSGNPCRMSSRR